MLSQAGMGECPLPRRSVPRGASRDGAGRRSVLCVFFWNGLQGRDRLSSDVS